MSNETCPHCEAELDQDPHNHQYICGTLIDTKHYRTEDCYERQIEQQAAEIERLKKELNEAMQLLNEIKFMLPFLKR